MQISNQEFLHAIFGDEFIFAHVTDFFSSPSGGSTEWLGNHYVNYEMRAYSNQYFTISLFNETPDEVARRRKELFKSTHCIVLDDVGEKIDLSDLLDKIPAPSYILETSPGSQQWGYILTEPCFDRSVVENLLHGLISKLCPDGIDSGMAGVTRYVRLPEGYNNKPSKMKLNNGKPFKCNMLLWQPEVKVDIDLFAEAFEIDLSKDYKFDKSYGEVDEIYGANHPAWKILQMKEYIGEGKYDISCPWADEHTDPSDDRATVFISVDGSIGFKCHHGHCEKRGASDLLQYLKAYLPGWETAYRNYRLEIAKANPVKPSPIIIRSKK